MGGDLLWIKLRFREDLSLHVSFRLIVVVTVVAAVVTAAVAA